MYPMKIFLELCRDISSKVMAVVNTVMYATFVHVLLIFTINSCKGKFYKRGNDDPNVIELDFQSVDSKNEIYSRFKRETSKFPSDLGIINDNNQTKRLVANTFVIPDKNHTHAVVHWSGNYSNVLFVLTREQNLFTVLHSTFWRSSDYGASFTKIDFPSDAVLEMIYKNPQNRQQLILTDVQNKRLYLSYDEGLKWSPVDIPFSPDTLLHHPTDKDWILGFSLFEMQLFVSSDNGHKWTLLQEHVTQKFFWAVQGVDVNKYTVHMEITDYLASCEYKACIAPYCTDVTNDKDLGVVDPLSLIVQDEYIIVTKTKSDEDNPELFVSYKRGPFKKAYFPFDVHPRDYKIVSTKQNQVFVAVDHEENFVTLYLSDTTGQFYIPSLENIFSDIGWYQIEIDLYEVQGVPGTYISNRYTSVDSQGNLLSEQTFITFDKGGSWRKLNPPQKLVSSCKDLKECYMNLHLTYSRNNFNIPGIVTKPEAPGLILAHGRVGKSLYNGVQARVFISNDGGLSWKQAPFIGYYHLNILDQGGVITAIAQDNQTDIVYYSVDEGSTWFSHRFSDKLMYVDGVLNEPGINTMMMSVYGSLDIDVDRQMVQLNFSSVLPRKCSDIDYENWKPGEKNCILGQQMTYQRRKANAKCYNGRDYQRPKVAAQCLCSPDDYECDYGYELTDKINRICSRAAWYDESKIKHSCTGGHMYNRSQGYRKVASDRCVGGVENSDKYKTIQSRCPVIAPEGLQLRAAKAVFATGETITFKLSQKKGSEFVTTYRWSFGDGNGTTITGLENSTRKSYSYNKAGNYNVSVEARNNQGMTNCYITISIEDHLKEIFLEIPWGAQVGHVTQFNATLLGGRYSNFGLVHYVWKFGDKFKESPYLTWSPMTTHTYEDVGTYVVSVEAVNSVSTVQKEISLQVYNYIETVQLQFTANFAHINRGTFLSRNAASELLAIEMSKILYIPSKRLIVTIPNISPLVADITILPPQHRGLSIKQVISAIKDKIQQQELLFSLLTDAEDTIKVVGMKIIHAKDMPTSTFINAVTPQSHHQDGTTNNSLNTNTPVIVGVSVTLCICLFVGIGVFICRRKKKKDQRYSLIMNRAQFTDAMDEDYLEGDFCEGVEEYLDGEDDTTDGSPNIVINTGRHPTLVMMTGAHNNNQTGSDLIDPSIC